MQTGTFINWHSLSFKFASVKPRDLILHVTMAEDVSDKSLDVNL